MNRNVANPIQLCAELEAIAARDPGERGIAPLVPAARGQLLTAARSLIEHPRPHAVILTGFYVPTAAPPAAETDGPIGAVHLAAALHRCGVPVRLVTDAHCATVVQGTAGAAAINGELPVDVVEHDGSNIGTLADTWRRATPPVSHAIAIERAGPASDGVPRGMRGNDLTEWTAPLDRLFKPPLERIGIGDGGNELGMGSLPRELVSAHIVHGERIACRVSCEHLLICGISNWGGVALVAALAALTSSATWRTACLTGLDPEADRRLLDACLDAGAVDGVAGRPEASVDGIAWEVHGAVIQEMREVVDGHLQ